MRSLERAARPSSSREAGRAPRRAGTATASRSRRRCSSRSRCCAATGAATARSPSRRPGSTRPYLTLDEVLDDRARGAALGCHEALFTLGEAPEERYPQAARVARRARLRVDRRLPRGRGAARCSTRPGCSPTPTPARSSQAELERLRAVSPSQGMMIETLAARLGEPGGPHHGAPDKTPERRLATLEAAGARARPVHHRDPRRHRRDARRADRRARRDRATRTRGTATCRR